jgi:hypothetical protein
VCTFHPQTALVQCGACGTRATCWPATRSGDEGDVRGSPLLVSFFASHRDPRITHLRGYVRHQGGCAHQLHDGSVIGFNWPTVEEGVTLTL